MVPVAAWPRDPAVSASPHKAADVRMAVDATKEAVVHHQAVDAHPKDKESESPFKAKRKLQRQLGPVAAGADHEEGVKTLITRR